MSTNKEVKQRARELFYGDFKKDWVDDSAMLAAILERIEKLEAKMNKKPKSKGWIPLNQRKKD